MSAEGRRDIHKTGECRHRAGVISTGQVGVVIGQA